MYLIVSPEMQSSAVMKQPKQWYQSGDLVEGFLLEQCGLARSKMPRRTLEAICPLLLQPAGVSKDAIRAKSLSSGSINGVDVPERLRGVEHPVTSQVTAVSSRVEL